MTTSETNARLLDPRRAHVLDVLGPTIQFLTEPADGEPCVMRGVIPAGVAVPLHSHPDPETFLALSGAVEGLTGEDWVTIEPGAVFHVPAGARHAFRNRSSEPAVSIVVSSARLGRFFREARSPEGTPDAEALRHFLAVAERYGHWNGTPQENAEVGLAV
jgi:quercetin dioxygenase-like cupin family protein